MKLNLKVWRQKDSKSVGRFEMYQIEANEHMSFLEMMDVLNQQLIDKKQEPVAFGNQWKTTWSEFRHYDLSIAYEVF